MSKFLKQLVFVFIAGAIIASGVLVIRGATPAGNIKIAGGYQQYGSGKPVAWWKMDEASWNGTAGEVKDSIGANNGTSVGGANTTSTAVFGRAGSFDGTDDYMVSPIIESNSKTVSVWFKANDAGSGGSFRTLVDAYMAGGAGAYRGYRLAYGWNTVYWYVADSSKNNVALSYAVDYTQWHHAVGVHDSNAGKLYLYVDGVLRGDPASITGYTDSTAFIANTWFGRNNYAPDTGFYFNGLIDDVRIYNYALTANQVRQIYNETAKLKVSTGLVGYWKLDDNAATAVVKDYSGKGNNGTTTAESIATSTSVFSTTTSKIGGRAMSFDGTDDYVSISDSAILRPDNITLEVWIKPTGVHPQSGRIIEKGWGGVPTYASYIFRWDDAGGGPWNKLVFDIGKSGGYTSVKTVTTDFNDKWTHIVGTYDRQNLKIYVNGILENSTPETSAVVYTATSLFIGRYNGAGNFYFNGLIDEVKIYNYARTAEQIQQDYNLGLKSISGMSGNNRLKVSTGLVGYWKMDDNSTSSTSVIDYSGKSNNGTAYSGVGTATTTSVLSTTTAMIGGRAFNFDGSDNYIYFASPPSSAIFSNSAPWSISLWVYAATSSFDGPLIGYYYYYPLIAWDSSGVWFRDSSGTITYGIINQSDLSIGTWYFLSFVADGKGNLNAYSNGALKSTSVVNTAFYFDRIGGRIVYGVGYHYGNGAIDEVKVYNYARTAEQIQQDYARGLKHLP